MAIGWVRAYAEEDAHVKTKVQYFQRAKRAMFRSKFSTILRQGRSESSVEIRNLRWGDVVDLPRGLSSTYWTRAIHKKVTGFIRTDHLVEIAYVRKKTSKTGDNTLEATLDYKRFDPLTRTTGAAKQKLIWGDLVQIITRGKRRSTVRARGVTGKMNNSDLTGKALLDIYFVDVGQGDGVLVRTPDFRHLMIDGGLERRKQQTGKNAADLVDWKFFFDYGNSKIHLDVMMASHSDSDHYGGLHDLVRDTKLADRELDCLEVTIDTFCHPGLSRWPRKLHYQGLGPVKNGKFVRLLGDRKDAAKSTNGTGATQLSGPWRSFVKAVLNNSKETKVQRVTSPSDGLEAGLPLPDLWPSKAGCEIKVLGPVSVKESGSEALIDFKSKSKNTNGHSICLRVDYGSARILLTGDLNTKSMHWLEEAYGDRIAAFRCDVAKACHHGSHDISYRFLKEMEPSATIISSGDAEGHAHPRPEIVAASATTGYVTIDTKNDKLLTPLVYMTEIERSVTLVSCPGNKCA